MNERVVLMRCRMPTDLLCPCGAVSRRLRRDGIDFETRRVAQRRGDRPEVEDLTGQRRVPVLIDGDEVISDSKRILEHLAERRSQTGTEGAADNLAG